MNAAHIVRAVHEYIDTELAPGAASMPALDQFLYGLKLGIAKRKAESVVANLIETQRGGTLGVVDADGNVDIDVLFQSAIDSIHRVESIEIGGFRFKESDINKLYGILKRG